MSDVHDETGLGSERAQEVDADVIDLAAVGEGLLRDARNQPARRAARTVMASTVMRSTAIALLEGAEMNEHASPPAATLQVVTGEVRLVAGGAEHVLRAGEMIRIPPQRHGVRAVSDAVVLLTVSLH